MSIRSPKNSKTEGAIVSRTLFPNIGDLAPDAALTDTDGNSVILSSFWSVRPAILVFLRHFGCPFCREQIQILRKAYREFQSVGVEIVCVGQGPYKAGKAFSVYFDLPFPVLVSDDDLAVFGRYGLLKATTKQLIGLQVLIRGFAAIKNGAGSAGGDPKQMPGVFVVDTDGIVIFARRAQHQADNVSAAELLKIFAK